MIDQNDGLRFEREDHQYFYDGRPVRGVTEILEAAGYVDRRWFTAAARARGSAVHKAVELLARGDLDERTVDPRIIGYVEAARAFIAAGRIDLSVCAVEQPVYGCRGGVEWAGTPDLVGPAFGGEVVIDWKTGSSATAGLALAAYEMATREGRPVARRRLVVELKRTGRYRLVEHKDVTDYARFLAAAREAMRMEAAA